MGDNSGSKALPQARSGLDRSGYDPGRAELDMASAAAEYFNVYIGDWPKAQRRAAGRYLLEYAALQSLGD